MSGRDPFRDNGRFGVFTDVDHLGACIGLLMTTGQGHGVEFADRVVATQNIIPVTLELGGKSPNILPFSFSNKPGKRGVIRDVFSADDDNRYEGSESHQ